MMSFCAEHEIGAEAEVLAVDDVGQPYEGLKTGDERFRFVLDISTIAKHQVSRAA
jgi:alcohol dehydrogenase (NADP+)